MTLDFDHRFPTGAEIRVSLTRPLEPGATLVLFGPSGAGKTTVLRVIAGLLRPQAGRVQFGDHVWFESSRGVFEPPQNRRVGYVAQQPALFPHLTARGNIAYGLRKQAAHLKQRAVGDAAALVGATPLLERRPSELSGGEAQRVALARAFAPNPAVLLLDEPFAALDADTRRTLRVDLRRALRQRGASAVLVTHDRTEAIAMGDEVAVLMNGRVQQAGPLSDVFHRPRDPEVARVLGIETVKAAVVEKVGGGLTTLRIGSTVLVVAGEGMAEPGQEVYACVRAADVVVEAPGRSSDSARNHLNGIVKAIDHEGAVDRLTIDCGFELAALVTTRSREELGLHEGTPVVAAIKATAIHLVPKA